MRRLRRVAGGHVIAAQRDVEIVAQPARQRDVPALPEVGWRLRQVGREEVARELDAEQLGQTARDVGVGREVAIDLRGEGVHVDVAEAPRVGLLQRGAGLGDDEADIVGNAGLLEEAPGDQAEGPVDLLWRYHGATRGDLGQQLGGAGDRASDQLGKKRNEGHVIDERAGRLECTLVDVGRVADRVEGIEGDARRQRQGELGDRDAEAQAGGDGVELAAQPAGILEDAKQAQLHGDAQHEGCGAMSTVGERAR